MARITPTTTIAELAIEKTTLGVTHLVVNLRLVDSWRAHVRYHAHATTSEGVQASGLGSDEAEAINLCCESLRYQIGARLKTP